MTAKYTYDAAKIKGEIKGKSRGTVFISKYLSAKLESPMILLGGNLVAGNR